MEERAESEPGPGTARAIANIERLFPGTYVLVDQLARLWFYDGIRVQEALLAGGGSVGLFDQEKQNGLTWVDVSAELIGIAVQAATEYRCSVIFGRTQHGNCVITITAQDRESIKRYPSDMDEVEDVLKAVGGDEFRRWAMRHKLES